VLPEDEEKDEDDENEEDDASADIYACAKDERVHACRAS
jgi:hypothetical protein